MWETKCHDGLTDGMKARPSRGTLVWWSLTALVCPSAHFSPEGSCGVTQL